MRHIRLVSQSPQPAQVNLIEQAILFIFSAYFSGWDNFDSIFRNLQKYYSKTDE
jgi:hypothetical protein